MTTRPHFPVVFAVLLFSLNLLAQESDAKGCRDSPIIPRMPGSTIRSCENKEIQQTKIPVADDGSEKTIGGEYHRWDYATHAGLSAIQIFRNFESALRLAGFTIVHRSTPSTISARKGTTWYWLQNSGSHYSQTIVIETTGDKKKS